MNNIKVKDLLLAVKGELLCGEIGDRYITDIITDSRKKTSEGLFIAIKGENTDGHEYIKDAVSNGATTVLVSCKPEEYIFGIVYIKVEDTIKGLQDLATWYRLKFNIPIIAITGSVGKTTTKDMISSVLAVKYNVLKTEGNFNSEIGAPLTILRLHGAHEIAVIEMGMDHLRQIANISQILKPETAVITNIGIAHIEYLKTRENILKAKCEVFENLSKDGIAILNADDDMLVKVNNNFKKVWYGTTNNSDIRVDNVYIDYNSGVVNADIYIYNTKYDLAIPGLSQHLLYSAMAAVAVGLRYNISIEEILIGIKKYTHTKMRMDIYKLQNDILLIDDTYNANPDSMKSLIDTVKKSNKKNKILILGDMFELGSNSIDLHKEVLKYALDSGITKIVITGDNMKQASYMLNSKNIEEYNYKEQLIQNIEKIVVKNSIIAIKASRGMKFENITKEILEKN